MRLSPAIVIGAFALAACGERDAAPTPAEKVSAEVKVSDAVQAAPKGLPLNDLLRVCRAGLATIYGQETSALNIDGVEGGVVRASWRAPVDGGRTRAGCRVENDRVMWIPLSLPDQTNGPWMNSASDPVIRYVLDGEMITINQTLPNRTTEQAKLVVPAEEEGR